MLFAQDVVSRNPGTDVVFDVKCTRHLNALISSYGGRPIMWKSGHSLIKEKMVSTGALLGGEFTGHFFFKERWFGFDDGLYSAARLVEILSTTDDSLDSLLSSLPNPVGTAEIIFPVDENIKFAIIDQLINTGDFSGGKITTIDGLRIDFSDGWGLVRASNTGAALTLRFEGNNQASIDRIQQLFKEQLLNIEHSQDISF
jgi:phosphomannomutase/phosphoglucomutase